MAQYLDKTGLTTLWTKIKNTFALKKHTHKKSEITDLTIPTVNNPTITINQGGTKKGSFSLNQSGAATIDLTDNNTTYTAGTGLSLSSGAFSVKTGYTTSGKNYKVTTDSNGNLYVNVPWTDTNTNTWRPVVDNLTSTATDQSLSANQGKVLKGLIDGKAASSHTHNYLPLSGGTMTGNISYKGTKATYGMIKWIDNTGDTYGNGIRIGGGGATIIGGGESADLPSLSGGDEVLYLMNDGNIDFYSNCQEGLSSAKHMTFDVYGTLNVPTDVKVNGNSVIHSGNIGSQSVKYATTAGSANSVAWGNVTGKPSTFPPDSHTHSSVADIGNSTATTFAYSKSGLNYGDYTWLAGWNGYELRAVNKSQFATASHTHTKSQITDFSHTHSKSEVGLGNVDNTADANKNVNYATSSHLLRTYGANNSSHGGDYYLKCRHNVDGNDRFKLQIVRSNGSVTHSTSVDYANSAGSVAWGNVSGRPSSLPASNISMSFSNGVLTITYK